MRLVVVSNFYPPAHQGGYGMWCQEIIDRLRQRGHEIVVLTSRHDARRIGPAEPTWLRRQLYLEMELTPLVNSVSFFTDRRKREQANLDCFRQLMAETEPDLVFIWGMWNLPISLAGLAETMLPGRVVYYVGDLWPTLPSQHEFYWRAPAQNALQFWPKKVMAAVALRLLARETGQPLLFEHVLVPSAYVAQELSRQGIATQDVHVVPGAVDVSRFVTDRDDPCCPDMEQNEVELLYCGRLEPEKGTHVALEALGILVNRFGMGARLTLVGRGSPQFERQLRRLARQYGIGEQIEFVGSQANEVMPQFYRRAQALLFTSLWPESFGRVLIEAMAACLPIVASAVGGATEVLTDDENALLFAPGDADGLARQVLRLVQEPELEARLTATAKRQALERHSLQRMSTEIEDYLVALVA